MSTVENEEETKSDAPPALFQGTVFALGAGTQHGHAAPHRQAAERPKPASSAQPPTLEERVAQMESGQERILAILERQAAADDAAARAAQPHPAAAASAAVRQRRQTVGLPFIPQSPAATMDDWSAGAILPIPPRVPASRRRGASIGQPSTLPASIPRTPIVRAAAAAVQQEADVEQPDDSADEHDGESAEDVRAQEAAMPARDRRMEHVRKSMVSSIKSFWGNQQKDTYNVIDWVEKVDTEFSIQMGRRQAGRMDVVRALLSGLALHWANRRVDELAELGLPAEWQDIRADFINAHLGDSTVESFKAELRALRLGSGADECRTPSELNTKFDQLAELAFPLAVGVADGRADMAMARVLGEEYSNIVYVSREFTWKNIQRNAAPQTLDEWKTALARHWSAERLIQNRAQLKQQVAPKDNGGQGGGGQRGQRGRFGGKGGASLNAVQDDTDEREEGQPEPQLSAASAPGGGKGQSGGWTKQPGASGAEAGVQRRGKQQTFGGSCWICGAQGHRSFSCPKKAGGEQPGKGKAEQ